MVPPLLSPHTPSYKSNWKLNCTEAVSNQKAVLLVVETIYLQSVGIPLNIQIQEGGAAAASNLSIGDRILEVGTTDLRTATHETAVNALLSMGMSIRLLVRHDPPPRELEVRYFLIFHEKGFC